MALELDRLQNLALGNLRLTRGYVQYLHVHTLGQDERFPLHDGRRERVCLMHALINHPGVNVLATKGFHLLIGYFGSLRGFGERCGRQTTTSAKNWEVGRTFRD